MQIIDLPPAYARDVTGLRAAAPCLVFVGVSWCGHCTATRPILEKVAQALGWTVAVYYVDAEKRIDLAESLNVSSFPTIFFANNDGLFKFEGERTFEGLMGFVCEHTASGNYDFCTSLLTK
jgi:thioredoxin-like negative regulator of GroEL